MWQFYYIDTRCIFEFILTNRNALTCKKKQSKQKLFILMKLLFSSMQTQYIKIKWPFSVCEKNNGCFYVGLVDPIMFSTC